MIPQTVRDLYAHRLSNAADASRVAATCAEDAWRAAKAESVAARRIAKRDEAAARAELLRISFDSAADCVFSLSVAAAAHEAAVVSHNAAARADAIVLSARRHLDSARGGAYFLAFRAENALEAARAAAVGHCRPPPGG